MSESVLVRKSNEKKIVSAIIDAALVKGYKLNVQNGGNDYELPEHTSNKELLLETMFATDDEELIIFSTQGKRIVGWVRFIYGNGNSGLDVISDYCANKTTRELVSAADSVIESLTT